MNFEEIKCKFCGASLRVAPGTKEVTCDKCYNSFKLDEPPVNNNPSTNLPNPFASLSNDNLQNTGNNFNQPNPMNNMPNQFPNVQSNIGNQNIPIIPNNQPVQPSLQSIPEQPVNPQPMQPSMPSIPQQPMNQQVVPTYNEPVNQQPVKQPTIINTPPHENNNQNKKNKKKKVNVTKIVLYIFFIGLIIASGIVFYLDYTKEPEEPEIYEQLPSEIVVDDKDRIKTQFDDLILKLAPDVDLNQERAKYSNNDIVGRLEIPGLFNVLVTKDPDDNAFYLNHDIYKKYDIRGTEFLDFRVTPTSQQVNIYGHNTRDINIKVAFLKLEQFLKKDFFDQNQYVIFQHDQGKAAYKIIAIKEITSDNLEHMYVDKTGSNFVDHVKNMTTGEGVFNSREVPYDENSNIIVLQTCSHHLDNAFYTVIAVKVKDL